MNEPPPPHNGWAAHLGNGLLRTSAITASGLGKHHDSVGRDQSFHLSHERIGAPFDHDLDAQIKHVKPRGAAANKRVTGQTQAVTDLLRPICSSGEGTEEALDLGLALVPHPAVLAQVPRVRRRRIVQVPVLQKHTQAERATEAQRSAVCKESARRYDPQKQNPPSSKTACHWPTSPLVAPAQGPRLARSAAHLEAGVVAPRRRELVAATAARHHHVEVARREIRHRIRRLVEPAATNRSAEAQTQGRARRRSMLR